MSTGTVKFFNKSKGFGFIAPDSGGKEIFLPSATVTASGIKKIMPGLRVLFVEAPDTKGPKAVELKALDEPVRVPQAAAPSVTLYHDPASRASELVCGVLQDWGGAFTAQDYTATPPTPEELRDWSLQLSGSVTPLVRRSDSLFFALQLDDRFISESDFWLAISQHPSLINGPVLKVGRQVGICKTEPDVRRLLGLSASAEPAKPKGLSARLSQLLQPGAVVMPAEAPTAVKLSAPEKEPRKPAVTVVDTAKKPAPAKKQAAKPKAPALKAKPATAKAKKPAVAKKKAAPAKPAAKKKTAKR